MSDYMDVKLTPSDRAAALLAELSLEERIGQISCYFARDLTDSSDFADLFPLGVGEVSCLEARSATCLDAVAEFQRRLQAETMAASPHAIPAIFHMEGLCGAYLPGATSFPSGIARGAGWDPDLEHEIGEVVGRQERAVGITHTFAPVLDVSRDPRMGRHGETYGEDPTLASALGVALTRGLQSDDGEGLKTEAVAKHFLGFHQGEGGIHGSHCDIPGRPLREVFAKPFQAAITEGGLRGIMPCYGSLDGEPVSSSHRLLTGLLRDEMGFDGLTVSDYSAIANLHVVQHVAESLEDAAVAALRAGMDVELPHPQCAGAGLLQRFRDGFADIAFLDQAVLRVLTAKFRMGLFEQPFALHGEGLRETFSGARDHDVSLQSARQSLVLLRNESVLPLRRGLRKVAVIGCHATEPRFFFGGYTHLSMAEGLLAANNSMAGLTLGTVERKDVERTVPGTSIQSDDDPAFGLLLRRHHPTIRSLLDELRERMPETEVAWARGYPIAGSDTSGYEEAMQVAQGADLILMTLGGKHGTSSIASMGEGIDATDINLPACQDDLITELSRLGVPMVGVHLDGRPVSSDVADRHLDGLLEAWNPAEHGAEAIVDVLLGVVNPSGRLPVSVARNAGQVPVYYNHPWGSAWHQSESIGFPDYVDCPHTPRYPFGFGLSYTTFAYSDLRLSRASIDAEEVVEVTAVVTNTGKVAGTEVVQLYVTDRYASATRPVQELAGLCRVPLEPGQAAEVVFELPASQLAFLDQDMQWRVEAGDIDVQVGPSSEDIGLRGSFIITNTALVDGRTRSFCAPTAVRVRI